MHFYEFEAKRVLAKHGIPVPAERHRRETPAEVERAASEIGFPVVLKAQVLSRGLAQTSGVKPVAGPAEARQAAEALLQLDDGRSQAEGHSRREENRRLEGILAGGHLRRHRASCR